MSAGDPRAAAERLGAWGKEAREAFSAARDPARLATAVVTFHRRVDEVIAATVAGHRVPVACARGCSFCCHLRVHVYPHEAFALAAWLRRSLAPAGLAAVVARLRRNVERTRDLGEEGRKRANLACALLGEDGSCGAYEARPAQCRRWHSTRVDPCREFHASHDENVESAMDANVAHNADVIITQARHGVRAAGLDDTPTDLNVALLEALESSRSWRRWRDGKKAFAARD